MEHEPPHADTSADVLVGRIRTFPVHRHRAESARGVSPRASHRSGRDTLVSSGSCHRTKAAAFRREFELLPLPVGSLPNVGDLPPSLHEHYTRFITSTEQSAPLRRIGTFSLAGSPLVLSPLASPARFSSSVREPQMRVTPPIHRTPHGQLVGPRHTLPEVVVRPQF